MCVFSMSKTRIMTTSNDFTCCAVQVQAGVVKKLA